MSEYDERLRQAERRAETAIAIAAVALMLSQRPKPRKTIGDRLWDML